MTLTMQEACRRRKANFSAKRKKCPDDDSQVAKMSLEEFMKKGFSSDDEHGDLENSAHSEGAGNNRSKKVSKKLTRTAAPLTFDTNDVITTDDDSNGIPQCQTKSNDDIEDVESDTEVVVKPRTFALQADSDDEDLDDIELSDDDEDEIIDVDMQILTEKKLRVFLEQLRNKPDTNQIKRLTQMFSGAVCEASGDQDKSKPKYSVKGQRLFNAVVSGCLQDLLPAVHKVMKLPAPSVPKDGSKMIDPMKGHLWRKVKTPLTLYMADLLKLIGCITQQKLLLSLLRHLLLLLPFVRARPQIEKRVLKTLSRLWSTGEESVRVVTFLCLIRLIRSGDDATFQEVLKAMYLSYISNSKFTSPQTWPLISFMRRSLVEAYALRPNIAYQHSFLYIRQLAITLRTAMTMKKKDSHKSVYNWQFVHSLLLWCHLLATVRTAAMRPLIYPVVQVAIGVVNLIPSEKYIPLRLHVIRGLIELSANTETFVPIMPMLVTTLKQVHWKKKPKVMSLKPMNLSCALRVSEKQTKETSFRDAVIEGFQDMTLGYLTGISHLMGFPEIVIAAVIELKKIKLRVIKHQATIKQLLDKITENSRFIEKRRERAGLALKELEKIAAYELQLKGVTPLCVYSEKYQKLREQRIRSANEDLIEDYDSGDDQLGKDNSKEKNADKEPNEDEGMDVAEADAEDDRGLGKLDPDLDTDEEGDEEVGFEIAEDSDD